MKVLCKSGLDEQAGIVDIAGLNLIVIPVESVLTVICFGKR